ncbi:zinc finger, CCHC-type containing protein [Tanacetum coccineum]
MAVATVKHMALNFAKLDKFEGVDFRRWQKKMYFLLFSMSLVYVLTTPIPEDGENATMDQIRRRNKWDNDDYDSLEAKYMAEDASSKKSLVSNFTNYKMTDSRPVMEQYNELIGILGRFTQHKMNMDEAIQVSCIIDKLPSSWKDFKHTLKHQKEELTFVELDSHLRIEESLRVQDNDKPKGNNVVRPSVVNMVEHINSLRYTDNRGICKHHDNTKADLNKKSKVTCWKYGKPGHLKKDCKGGKDDDVAWLVDSGATVHVLNIVNDNIGSTFMSTSKLKDSILWHARLGHVHFKRMQDMSKNGLIPTLDMDTEKYKALDKFKVFKTEVELQQGSQIKRFRTNREGEYMDTLYFQSIGIIHEMTAPYTPQQNGISEKKIRILSLIRIDSLQSLDQASGFLMELKTLVVQLSLRRATEEVVQQLEPKTRKAKRNMTPKNFRPEFQLYLIEGTRDEVSDQHFYCFNIEDDPKTFDVPMKSQDVAF